ncbi:hypothetical protein BRAS3843_1480043 [Bradyrhizobium sp. STM 3843]|uniref:hypothetical protein n=1 Tax=Bradyrhizobium sp. STM 3843 TaxID=551947 RepID=UPI0002406BB6|nr:hypothetical protein [Bradyrhizobium sp. STM 3843]CCE05812.1 hypothetical protein BRAS3843_1480043 [Bradyrhizobium sp. STM 3843]
MPAGFRVIEQVASLLSETEARLVSEIAPAVGKTPRAIRYALAALMGADRARRHGDTYYACQDIRVDVIDVATGNTLSSTVLLRECFPGDFIAYGIARRALAHKLMITVGGGVSPLLEIRRTTQAEAA